MGWTPEQVAATGLAEMLAAAEGWRIRNGSASASVDKMDPDQVTDLRKRVFGDGAER